MTYILGILTGIVLTIVIEIALVCYIGGEYNKWEGKHNHE